tara:strand:- start:3252 stop:3623 length:372 start_codon:yes stop_codon:yes gene_type:complete
MSVPVEKEDLIQTIQTFGPSAYLITSAVDDHPHVTHLGFTIVEQSLRVQLGKRSTKNVQKCPFVTILWPPHEQGGYNLIVDGTITRTDDEPDEWEVIFQSAILHRPAKSASAGDDCGSDCKPI